MNLGRLNKRITFEKSVTESDEYGNRKPTWEKHFECWATVTASGRRSEENEQTALTTIEDYIDVTVRWSSETKAVNPKEYRILIDGDIYDIMSCNNAGYAKKMRIFTCAIEPR